MSGMPLFVKVKTLLRNLLSTRRVEADLDHELHSHLEMLAEEKIGAGTSLQEAQRAARIELGGIEQLKQQLRDQRLGNWLHSVLFDCRFALRQLRKSPAFTIVAVLTLALGIGVNATIFTLINGFLLRPLPYPHAERVVEVDREYKDGPYYGMSLIEFRTFQRQNQTFQYLAAYDMLGSGLNLATGAEPELIHSRRVTADFFRVLGIPLAIGRDFSADDDRPDAAPVVVLSYRIWKNLFGGNPAAVGQPVHLGGEAYTVIGVTPRNFAFSPDTEAWVPIRTAEDPADRSSAFKVIGRLRPAVSYEFAREDLDALTWRIRQDYPGIVERDEVGTLVTSYQERVVGDLRPVLLLLASAVACILLIACSNIASLLLARAVNRRKEIAIRTALGVTRGRLIRQLLTETMLLSAAGGAVGLWLAHWGIRLFLAFASIRMPNTPVVIDVNVLLFTLALSLLTGLIFGTAPALQFGRLNSADVLRESGRATASVSTRRRQGLLVSLEICLATILLLGAGLLLSSLSRLLRVSPGFDPQHVLTVKTSFVGSSFATSPRVDTVVRKAVNRLQSLAGVQAVAAATMLPTEPSVQLPFELPSLPPKERPTPDSFVQWRAISPAYFEVMNIPLLQGRRFSESDSPDATSVAIVNQAFIQKHFSRFDGMQQPILIARREGPQFADHPRQIVGVVADTREISLNLPASPTVFIPLAQVPNSMIAFMNSLMPMNWLIRVSGDALASAPFIHREFLAVDPDLVSSNPRTLTQVLSESLAQQQTETALVGFFSVAALSLAAIGLYGVLAYSVAQRKQELGIRMALGAGSTQILRLVIVNGLKLAFSGILIGIVVGLVLTRLMGSLLFGISSADPLTYTLVVALLVVVALVACLIPARRATRVDPMVALRYE
jgi:putative ABC transport system permease protein